MSLNGGTFGDGWYWHGRAQIYWTTDFNGDFFPLEGSFVSQTLELRWEITGEFTFVSDTLELQWNINNLIADTVELRWTILEAANLRITRSNIAALEEGATSGERQTQITYASIMVISGVTDALPSPPARMNSVMIS